MKVCTVDGCNGKHKGYGYCDKHYQRFKKHGNASVCFNPKKCNVEGCDLKYYGRGFCSKHYQRWVDHGDINHERGSKFKSPYDAYLSCLVNHGNDKCWGWIGAKHKFGYGTLPYLSKKWAAHRFSYEYHIGKIPKGMLVCHHCDNPECSNPKHLFLGTNLDNIKDCVSKGRHPFQSHNRIKK